MLIIDENSKPIDTIYYTAGCIMQCLKKESSETDEIYNNIRRNFNENLDFSTYLLALNFLFLIDKVMVDEKGILKCI